MAVVISSALSAVGKGGVAAVLSAVRGGGVAVVISSALSAVRRGNVAVVLSAVEGGVVVSEVSLSPVLAGRGGGGGITEAKAFCRSWATCKHSTSSNRQKTPFHVVG